MPLSEYWYKFFSTLYNTAYPSLKTTDHAETLSKIENLFSTEWKLYSIAAKPFKDMDKISYYPQNKEYFEKLLSFSKVLFDLCNKLGIKPIVYGSLSYAVYVRNTDININDIDLLVPEASFSEFIDLIKNQKELSYEMTDYHSLKVFRDGAKITLDSIERYYSGLPLEFVDVEINGISFTIVTVEALKEIYKRGVSTIITKREEYQKKLNGLAAIE